MPRSAPLVLVLLALAAALAVWLLRGDPGAPPTPVPPAGSGAAGVAPATGTATTSDPAEASTVERSDAAPRPAAADLVYTVQGFVVADRRSPDLHTMRVVARRGEPADQMGSLMSGMTGPGGPSTEPAFVLRGEPIASAEVDTLGTFTLRCAERHLRLVVEHDLYALPVPQIVHVPTEGKRADVVLTPLLGGCLRGRLLGERKDDVAQVKLLLEVDPMAVMRDSRAFLGAITSAVRPGTTPLADGSFTFRGVMPNATLTLVAESELAVARLVQPGLEPGEVRDVVLPVRAAAALVVSVRDESGAPVAAARVEGKATSATGMLARLQARRGSTDAQGRCVLRGLEAERIVVEASAKGRIGASATIDLLPNDPPQELQLTLGEGGIVTGTVTGPDGKPVADAGVAHHPSEDLPLIGDMATQLGPDHLAAVAEQGVRTDAEGRFRLTGLADSGTFLVVAARKGYTAGYAKGVRMGDENVVVALQPLGAVHGRVVAAEDESAPATFTVSILRTSFFVMRVPVRQTTFDAGAAGTFAIDGVAPGSYTLQVAAEGFSDLQKDLEVGPGTTDVGTLSLQRGAWIAGVVRDDEGQPVRAALVRRRQGAMGDNPMLALFAGDGKQAHSDAEGRFRLGPLPPGRLQLLATADGFASGRSDRVQLKAGQALDGVSITLGHGGSIRGRLVLGPGQQFDEFLILAQEQGTQATQAATPGPEGTFTVENLDPGQYTVQAMPNALMRSFGDADWKPGQGLRFAETFQKITDQVVSQRCAVRAGEATEVTLDASEVTTGSRWIVRVEVGGAALESGLVEATSLDDGRVRVAMLFGGEATFGAMPAGAHRVQVRGGMTMVPVGPPQDVDYPASTNEHRTTLSLPGGELRGRVVDATTGQPLRAALVRLLHDDHAERDDPVGMALTEASGEFRFPGLADGSYGLVVADLVNAPGDGAASRRRGIQVRTGVPTEPIELRAMPAATASVLVTNESGSPIAGATVLCVDRDGQPLGALGLATSGPDGRAAFGGMPRGAARVVGRAPGFAPGATDVQEIGPEQPVEFALRLASGSRTVLQAVDRNGQPLAGASVQARCNGGPWLPALLLVEGTRGPGVFELGRLCRGAWEFRVTHPGVGTIVQARAIGAEATVTVVVTPR